MALPKVGDRHWGPVLNTHIIGIEDRVEYDADTAAIAAETAAAAADAAAASYQLVESAIKAIEASGGRLIEDPDDPGTYIHTVGVVEDPDDPGTFLIGE